MSRRRASNNRFFQAVRARWNLHRINVESHGAQVRKDVVFIQWLFVSDATIFIYIGYVKCQRKETCCEINLECALRCFKTFVVRDVFPCDVIWYCLGSFAFLQHISHEGRFCDNLRRNKKEDVSREMGPPWYSVKAATLVVLLTRIWSKM